VTQIEIINLALSDCGANLITSVNDNLPEARQAKAKYVPIRDAVLEMREWTFAKQRLLLAQDAVAPAFGYTYQYILPSNVLRVIRLHNNNNGVGAITDPLTGSFTSLPDLVDDWVREGARVLTNQASPIYAEVLMRVDEGQFSPGFVITLAARLTAAFAIPLTENRQLAKDFMDFFQASIKDAGAMDGSQGRTLLLRPPPLPGRRQNM
jgi:hypothetical protein